MWLFYNNERRLEKVSEDREPNNNFYIIYNLFPFRYEIIGVLISVNVLTGLQDEM